MAQILRVADFQGYTNLFAPASKYPPSSLKQMDWMIGMYDWNNSVGKKCIISKSPQIANMFVNGNTDGFNSGTARGIFYSWTSPVSNDTHFAFIAVNDGPSSGHLHFRSMSDISWSLLTDTTITYNGGHTHWEAMSNKILYTFNGGLYKWMNFNVTGSTKAYRETIVKVKDKGGTAVALTGTTLTWNANTIVNSSDNCNTFIKVGDWIRRSSSSIYWDEVAGVSLDGLIITLTETSLDTGIGDPDLSQKAPDCSITAREIKSWKGKLWILSGGTTLYWTTSSVTGVFSEDFSSQGAGELEIDTIDCGTSQYGTGVEFLGDYMFVWRERSYLVYRWTGDVTLPIELVRSVAYGCDSQNTIHRVGDVIYYHTGNEVRITNGGSDISISKQVEVALATGNVQNNTYYSSTVAYGNNMPTSFYEPHYGLYVLCKAGNEYWFDIKTQVWIGMTKYGIGSACTSWQLDGQSQLGRICFHPNINSYSPQYIKFGSGDYSNKAVMFSGGHDMTAPDKKKKIYWVEFELVPQPGCNTNIYFDWWDFNATKDTPVTTSANTNAITEPLVLASGYTGSPNYSVKVRFQVQGCEVYNFGWVLYEDNISGSASAGWGIANWIVSWDPCDTA